MPIVRMGHVTAIGMRTPVQEDDAIVINTCGRNDTAERGDPNSWTWSNPTNRALYFDYEDIAAVSVECLWQGTKIREGMTEPDPSILQGNWRGGKGKRPIGAWAGKGNPLITTPGEARRRIYIPAFKRLLEYWMQDEEVRSWVEEVQAYEGPVYLRDFDTGRGIDRNGPMSHAWVIAMWMNTGSWAFAS